MPSLLLMSAQTRFGSAIGSVSVPISAEIKIDAAAVVQDRDLILGTMVIICELQGAFLGIERRGVIPGGHLRTGSDGQTIDFNPKRV